MTFRRAITLALCPLTAGTVALAVAAPATAATAAPSRSTVATSGVSHATGAVAHVVGTVNGRHQAGTFAVTQFVPTANGLNAVGNLTMGGKSLGQAAVPVNPAATTGSCPILHLDLGPLDLNLLGLQVHLNEVVLNIAAQGGPGNLLGNLLCAVAGLLDGSGSLSQLSGLLNQILTLLNL